MNEVTTKYCSFCEEEHPLTLEFWFFRKRGASTQYDCLLRRKTIKSRWRLLNKEREKENCRKNYQENKGRSRDTNRRWCTKNRQKAQKRSQKWHAKNPNYENDKYRNDLNFRLKSLLRARVYRALKKKPKVGSAVESLGCSIEELKAHIESMFQPGMSWDNWSKDGWHIDHIKPLIAFDLSDPEQLKLACHYTNLQPLWAKDNLSKGGKFNDRQPPPTRYSLLATEYSIPSFYL